MGDNGYRACTTNDNPCQLADFNGGGGSYPTDFFASGGKLYIGADDGFDGWELWVVDVFLFADGVESRDPEAWSSFTPQPVGDPGPLGGANPCTGPSVPGSEQRAENRATTPDSGRPRSKLDR